MNNKTNEMNLNINQIINPLNQSQDKPQHNLTINPSMNGINSNQLNTFSSGNNNSINMTQYNSQYNFNYFNNFNNFNTINYNQNSNQCFNGNNQINFMNNSFIMNMNYNNTISNYFNLNNNTRGLRRQMSATNILEVKDPYPDIHEAKILIIFERNDKIQHKVKVPLSFRMVELYYTAVEFKINKYSKMELFYNNKYLKEDDKRINIISNGDKVIMAENLDELNNSIYKNLYQPNLSSGDIVNIIFNFSFNNKIKTMAFSKKTKIRDMFKMFYQENKIIGKGKQFYKFLLNSNTLNVDDNSPLGNLFNSDGKTIIVDYINELNVIKGKKLEVEVRNKRKKLSKTTIGTLNKIKDLYFKLEQNYTNHRTIQRISIKGKEVRRDDERTFFSINVRENFKCIIHFRDDDEIERENNRDNHCIII
jgi:hypothetical protein